VTTASLYILYSFLAVGAASLFLCLPSGRGKDAALRWAIRILAAAALSAITIYWVRWIGQTFDGRVFFVIFGLIAIIAAARVVTHPQPIYCALYLVVLVLAVTALCLLAAAEFLAAALVIVYAGAILVTYVFVIMLSRQQENDPANLSNRESLAAVALGFLLTAAVTQAMVSPDLIVSGPGQARSAEPAAGMSAVVSDPASVNGDKGNVQLIGEAMMTTYILAVETAGVLLLVALVGAVALARKRIEPQALTPAELASMEAEKELGRIGREVPPF